MSSSTVYRVVLAVFLVAGIARSETIPSKPAPAAEPTPAPATSPPPEAQAVADQIARDLEQIRGLDFKQPVHVESQSVEKFGEYVSRELNEQVPESLRAHYGHIVRALGLYRGPLIEDFSGMMSTVMTSQVGAYYDPEKKSFFVLMNDMPEMMMGVMYSHELYHALQDQYFELQRYMARDQSDHIRARNSDADIARSALVEGEATYVMSLWMAQKMSGKPPTRDMMGMMVAQMANVNMDQLRASIKNPEAEKMLGSDFKNAVAAADEIPAFIMESMIGVYLKGMSFVHSVHDQGWPAVEKAYTEYPPQSTEHILHPDKWLAREAPVVFAWPKFAKVKALRDWELLDDDVLGEFQWRIIFKEQGLAKDAESASAGWGGDRYAVFKRKDSDATLLLLRTAWDNEAEATEFADAYRRLQAAKFSAAPTPVRVDQDGTDVFIVEGGEESQVGSLLKFVKQVRPRKS
ncbi:MAG TPA: hypothetical protein VFL16_11600 [Steroidobacteraceae bacterium]|jgi:hypothetical protein|nr:hypothetical protein [Steroidobacteraceae bacterium]